MKVYKISEKTCFERNTNNCSFPEVLKVNVTILESSDIAECVKSRNITIFFLVIFKRNRKTEKNISKFDPMRFCLI